MGSATRWMHRTSLALLAVAASISILWGIALEKGPGVGVMGFPGIYLGTKCLLQGGDPYNVQQLQNVYEKAGINNTLSSPALRQSVTLYVNLPPTFLLVAPFALLPLATAQALWMVLVVASFLFAAYLMWNLAERYAASLALLLTFIMLANCEILFSGGNTAGFVVSLAVIATWCFLQDRFPHIGVLCLAISLSIKPHDAGLIWLYFLLAGSTLRKRAIQACALSLFMVALASLWVSHVAPRWVPELGTNLATISGPGGINEPGPTSIGVGSPDMIIDLQTVLSLFGDDPHVYNPLTYVLCGTIFLAWLIAIMRFPASSQSAWFALVSCVALSMLVTYHRSYDAKLLLLSIPACAMLWKRGGPIAWAALLLSSAGIVCTADIPLAILMRLTRNLYSPGASIIARAAVAVATRPAPLVLLAIAIFYLFVYIRLNRGEALAHESTLTPISSC